MFGLLGVVYTKVTKSQRKSDAQKQTNLKKHGKEANESTEWGVKRNPRALLVWQALVVWREMHHGQTEDILQYTDMWKGEEKKLKKDKQQGINDLSSKTTS